MAESNQSKRAPATSKPKKPTRPHPDFPLFPHANGRWAKKVRGKFVYFGKCTDDPKGQAALDLWLDQKDDLLAGRMPREKRDGLTVDELCQRFLHVKKVAQEAGAIAPSTWRGLHGCPRNCATEARVAVRKRRFVSKPTKPKSDSH